MVKDKLFLMSKEADKSFVRGSLQSAFELYWFNTPTKDKCLNVSFESANYPACCVMVSTNTQAMVDIKRAEKSKLWKEERF
jgi:hypothetical protein